MNLQAVVTTTVAAGGVWAVLWALTKIGKALTAILEALATLAAVGVAVWLVIETGPLP